MPRPDNAYQEIKVRLDKHDLAYIREVFAGQEGGMSAGIRTIIHAYCKAAQARTQSKLDKINLLDLEEDQEINEMLGIS